MGTNSLLHHLLWLFRVGTGAEFKRVKTIFYKAEKGLVLWSQSLRSGLVPKGCNFLPLSHLPSNSLIFSNEESNRETPLMKKVGTHIAKSPQNPPLLCTYLYILLYSLPKTSTYLVCHILRVHGIENCKYAFNKSRNMSQLFRENWQRASFYSSN